MMVISEGKARGQITGPLIHCMEDVGKWKEKDGIKSLVFPIGEKNEQINTAKLVS